MKKTLLTLLGSTLLFSGCQMTVQQTPSPTPSSVPVTPQATVDENLPSFDAATINLVITEENYGIEEIYGVKDEPLKVQIRNQRQEPINVVIDELRVKSPDIAFGKEYTVTVPTSEAGEFEMYSSIGTQRKDGFSALVIIEDAE